jgi:TorA maturation chaperone TorD
MSQALQFSTPDDREEIARAEVYGLLALLFYAAPSADLYSQLQVAPTEAPAPGAYLEASWSELVAASRRLGRDAVADEFDALFVSIGKPEIFLYASHHIAGALNEKPLVALRDTLAQLGLARAGTMAETEDHLAYLCEVMRFLIAGDDLAVSNLATQQRFFNTHLRAWSPALWQQIGSHPRADFYRALSRFAGEFFAVEGQAFDMLE